LLNPSAQEDRMAPKPQRTTPKPSSKRSPAEAEVTRLREENAALRKQLESLQALVYRDPLTGLRNRRAFEERLREEIARAARRPGTKLSLVILDVDHFKDINDTLGHAAGDAALVWIARFLESQIRQTDYCCRTGGDEFIMILPDTCEMGASVLVGRLRARVEALHRQGVAPAGLSFGVATLPGDGSTPEELVGRGDARMYADKQRRGRVRKGAPAPVSTPASTPAPDAPASRVRPAAPKAAPRIAIVRDADEGRPSGVFPRYVSEPDEAESAQKLLAVAAE
jgi:diguanylate cyclase (GGDEF)-like protein